MEDLTSALYAAGMRCGKHELPVVYDVTRDAIFKQSSMHEPHENSAI